MKIWAISDLHLSFSTPNKSMDIFGDNWIDHAKKIENNWKKNIQKEDLVLIAGDISWALKFEEALIDLQWLDRLPGKKILIKGNHDFWWPSKNKLKNYLPSSLIAVQNAAAEFEDIAVGGTRLWDSSEFTYNDSFPEKKEDPIQKELQEKIYKRELQRLELSLKSIDQSKKIKIALTHYPPIGPDLKETEASKILKKYNINICLFGHLHSLKNPFSFLGEKENIQYYLTSADAIDFNPIRII